MSMTAVTRSVWVTGHCYPPCPVNRAEETGTEKGGSQGTLTPWTPPLFWVYFWPFSMNPPTIPAKEVPFSWFLWRGN